MLNQNEIQRSGCMKIQDENTPPEKSNDFNNWSLKRLKDLVIIKKGKAVSTIDYQKEGYFPLIDTSFLRGKYDKIVYANSGFKINESGILILWDGANAGELFYNDNKGFLGSTLGFAKIKNKKNLNKYLYYCLKGIEKEIRELTVGMGIPHVNGSKLKQISISFPNIENQFKIVDFLEKAVKKIDFSSNRYEKKIELLKEYKESLIYETVTKGLNADVKMKESGENWIGGIPIDWSVKRIKDIAKISTGGTPPRDSDDSFSLNRENNLMWIKPANLEGYKKIIETQEYITPFGLNFIKRFDGKKSIIFSGIGDIGKMGITDNSFTTNQQNHVIQSTNCNIKFLFYSLYSQREKIKIIAKGNVVKIFNASELKRVKVALPNKNDQDVIVAFLDKKTNETDRAIDALFKKVALLNELKESIIYEAVTGQLDIDADGDKYLAMIKAL